MRMRLCPVCVGEIAANAYDAVGQHLTVTGDICPMSGQPMPQWDEDSTRRSVRGRSMGVCEFCRELQATDMHHRMSRGVGGWWSPAQILHLCRTCHAWATQHPAEAYQSGVMVRSRHDPESIPVTTKNGQVIYLTDAITT